MTQARVPKRLPVVLTEITVTYKLIAGLLYGAGLRLMEVVRLRVKDVEFARGEIVVRDARNQSAAVVAEKQYVFWLRPSA